MMINCLEKTQAGQLNWVIQRRMIHGFGQLEGRMTSPPKSRLSGVSNVSLTHFSYQPYNFSVAVERVKYFRDRSARNRAREEKDILESEMARTTRSFVVMQKAWSDIGGREHENRRFADSAYAYKQAALYERLANDSKAFEEKAEKKRQVYQQWYNFEVITLNQVTSST